MGWSVGNGGSVGNGIECWEWDGVLGIGVIVGDGMGVGG